MDELKKEFKALSNIHWIISFCTFDESDNEYRSERIPEYSLGFVNGTWYAMQEQQCKIEHLKVELSQQNVQLMHARQNVETLSGANEKLDIERDKLRAEKEQLEKEKAEITRLVQSLRNEFDLWADDGDAIETQIELLEKTLRGES